MKTCHKCEIKFKNDQLLYKHLWEKHNEKGKRKKCDTCWYNSTRLDKHECCQYTEEILNEIPLYKKLKTENETLKTKNETLKTENETLKTENTQLKTEDILDIEKKNLELKTENTVLKNENKKYKENDKQLTTFFFDKDKGYDKDKETLR